MTDNDTDRLEPKEAQRKINGIAKLGYITPTNHLSDRMEERGYDFQDLEQILSLGKVKDPPEYDEKYEQPTVSLEEQSCRFLLVKRNQVRVEATLVLESSRTESPWKVVYLKWNNEILVDRDDPLGSASA